MEPVYVPAGYMSAHQVARYLGVGLPGVRKLVQRGRLDHVGGTSRQPWFDSDQVRALRRQRAAA